jgi:hypothetical protein
VHRPSKNPISGTAVWSFDIIFLNLLCNNDMNDLFKSMNEKTNEECESISIGRGIRASQLFKSLIVSKKMVM